MSLFGSLRFHSPTAFRDAGHVCGGQGEQRRVPQHVHPHVVLMGGANAVEKFVPGFQDDCVAAGAVIWDVLDSVVKVPSAQSWDLRDEAHRVWNSGLSFPWVDSRLTECRDVLREY